MVEIIFNLVWIIFGLCCFILFIFLPGFITYKMWSMLFEEEFGTKMNIISIIVGVLWPLTFLIWIIIFLINIIISGFNK